MKNFFFFLWFIEDILAINQHKQDSRECRVEDSVQLQTIYFDGPNGEELIS